MFILAIHLFTGHYPSAISIANVYLVGLGLGLVVARIGRLGPFEGILGTPWLESSIQEMLTRETARALRYERELTVAALRPTGGNKIDVQRGIRVTDQAVSCRDGWHVLVLPETDRASAILLLRQICGETSVQVALVTADAERPRQRVAAELLQLMRASNQPGAATLGGSDTPDFLPSPPLAG